MSGEGLDLSAVLGKLTENPDMLKGILSSITGDGATKEKPSEDSPAPPTVDPEVVARLAPVMSALSGKSSPKNSPRCNLLQALRPYLSPSRREAVDYMIRLDGLSGILGNMNPKIGD
jgi:hypothetical protein